MDQNFHAGGEGNVLANGADMAITGWDATETTETTPSTSTRNYNSAKNKTYKQSEPTLWGLSGSFKLNYDSNASPFPNIRSGNKVALQLFAAYSGSNISCPKALITGTPVTNPGMNGIIEITVNWESYGEYTFLDE